MRDRNQYARNYRTQRKERIAARRRHPTAYATMRPRRCPTCAAPILLTPDGPITDDHGELHRC